MPAWALIILEKFSLWCWSTKCWKKVAPLLGYKKTITVIVTEKEEIIPKPHE